ncbi:MAG: polysaccharide pyruvyl transferase family protein [Armatimonadota bacterium]
MHSPERTGVLTFHRCINYGSYWQARCLVEALQARGHDAVLLDHQSRRVNFAEWRCALRPTLPTPVPREDRLLYRLKLQKFFRAFAALPLSRPFDLDHPETMEPFDHVVVGSDEVWNLRHPWYSHCGLFYGVGVRARRLTAYAASFGSYHCWEGLGEPWPSFLRRFEAISVRDENAWWHLRNSLGVEPEVVLDPCLLERPRPSGRRSGAPYVAVYGHNFSDHFARQARRWAGARGLPLVSIGYRNAWADRHWLTAGPLEFARFMAGAEAVVTNFFHGCVFALRNEKRFVCEVTPYRSIKVENLMATVGGEQHLISPATPPEQFETRLDQPLDPAMLQRIEALRQSSGAYLDRIAGAAPKAPARREMAAA